MEFKIAPFGIGSLVAVVVLILAIIVVAGAIPATPTLIFGCIGALAIARLT